MFLPSLYEFAQCTKARHGGTLLDSPEFSSRYLAWLIDLKGHGDFNGFVPLMTTDEPGKRYDKLPRTLEPKDSGTIAEFLVEDPLTILGLGESPTKPIKENAQKKHEHFWARLEEAAKELAHPGLKVVLQWRLSTVGGHHLSNLVYEPYLKPGGRGKPKEQWLAITKTGAKEPLYFRANTSVEATFSVDGNLLVLDEAILEWWTRWFRKWVREREEACRAARGGGRVCILTGDPDAPISNSHLPKIMRSGVFQSFGATLASAEAESFHSYGLAEQVQEIPGTRKGPDASYANVSVRAAIGYCNALNYLLDNDDHHLVVRPMVVCFWAKQQQASSRFFAQMLNKPEPRAVQDFLKSPWAGLDRQLAKQDLFYSVTLSGNAGRVVVRHWMQQTLEEAVENIRRWFEDLQMVEIWQPSEEVKKKRKGKPPDAPQGKEKEQMPPLAIFRLACATVRDADDLQADVASQLYHAALEGTAPSLSLLKPVLQEFHSALVGDTKKKPRFPFNLSRFALLRLILNRNRKEGVPMIEPKVFETTDEAYNSGRLLAVLAEAQAKAHEYKLEGAGVAERYFGTASVSPSSVFPLLLRLNRHHLDKISKSDKYRGDERYLEQDIQGILRKFQPASPGQPPQFRRYLDLQEQGRFALGFYQQKAEIEARKAQGRKSAPEQSKQ